MSHIDIIDEHIVIRETVGYEILNQVDVIDVPAVLEFLKVIYNYKRMISYGKANSSTVVNG